ncbi:MAG: hypothetical protein WEB09_11405 [Nitriliruptor sp.]
MSDEVTDQGQPAGRLEVVHGGEASAEELAALVVALTPVGGEDTDPDTTPAWARAALLEGVGMLPPTHPADLRRTSVLGG